MISSFKSTSFYKYIRLLLKGKKPASTFAFGFDIYQNILKFDKNAKLNTTDWYQKNHSSDVIIKKFKKVLNL